MAKLDARRVGTFLADPGPCRAVLLHGDDAGLVRERAEALVLAVAGSRDDPFRVAELTREAAVRGGALAGEAAAQSLTGGRRVVRVRDATDGLAGAVKEALAERGGGDSLIVLEAGELTARSKLRVLLEEEPRAAVIGCYRERGAELAASIGRMLKEHGVEAEPSALDWLAGRLGEDRLLMRREVEKIALYAGAGGRVGEEDAVACVAEGAALDLDEALMAATAGRAAEADRALDAAFADGANPVQVVRAALRHVQRLHLASVSMGQGGPAAAMGALRPPVFFRHRPAFETALRLWPSAALEAAAGALLEAEKRTKTTALKDAVDAVARAAVMALARQAVGFARWLIAGALPPRPRRGAGQSPAFFTLPDSTAGSAHRADPGCGTEW
jgi:DNA polymerase-3 subunit delta